MNPRSLVAAIDQGTTSSRCILFDRSGRPVASHQLEHAQITPRPGWVEHDAEEILERVRTCIRVALREAGADARALAAVGISDQRETTVVWSRRTGRPVHNAIVWQDTRTAAACDRLAADGGVDRHGGDEECVEGQPRHAAARARENLGGREPAADGEDDRREVHDDAERQHHGGGALRQPQPRLPADLGWRPHRKGRRVHSSPRSAARAVARFSPAIEAVGLSDFGQ